jgi:hypothetical protein
MKHKFSFIIRCGTPDCEWGFPMPDPGEVAFKCCYSEFRKHRTEVHGVNQDNASDCLMRLDLDSYALEVSDWN